MAGEPSLTGFNLPVAKHSLVSDSKIWLDYLALTKPEVNFLILVTTFAGFYLGLPSTWHDFPFLRAVNAAFGTLLVASGTGALNQYTERRYDAEMRRTARRPLAAGRLKPSSVLWFGITLSACGTVYLGAGVNLLASLLALSTLLSYLLFYTPLKRKSPLCSLVGAFSGAMPPLIGWAAATDRLSFGAWILYSLLFLWQFPHFMSIAWMYRDDYARAGYLVLPQDEHARASLVNWQTLLPLLLLMPVSLLPALTNKASIAYGLGSALLGAAFLSYGIQFVFRKSNASARRLLVVSIIYLPSLFALMIFLGEGSGGNGCQVLESIFFSQSIGERANVPGKVRMPKSVEMEAMHFRDGVSDLLLFDRDAIGSNHNSRAISALLTVNKYLRLGMGSNGTKKFRNLCTRRVTVRAPRNSDVRHSKRLNLTLFDGRFRAILTKVDDESHAHAS